ncbi:zinc finger protein 260-like isoform X2 [Clinocottus analis]|uniref:zinc finger protein 260-like isoform X2 n=1 Tax=Clinocottus analis TaxID=304258 RepID=UPI0035BF7770
MSRAELLRGFVTRRLAAASREILAVVDRIVTGYEEEAAGFRGQIDRQQKQLELLQHRTASAAGESDSLCPVEEEEGDEEEEPPQVPTEETPSRRRRDNRKPGRLQASRTHTDLRIRILEDSGTDVLSNNVLQSCPLLALRCPPGLGEQDFLSLLRCSVPQLAAGGGFDVLTAVKRKLRALTGAELQRSAGGKRTLYIRLKTKKEPQAEEEEDEEEEEESLQTSDEAGLHSSSIKEVEGRGGDESINSTSQHQDMETEEDDDDDEEEEGGTPEPAESTRGGDGVEKEKKEACRGEPRGSDGADSFLLDEPACSGEKPHECDVCREAFASKASLQDHQKRHEAAQQTRRPAPHNAFPRRDPLAARRGTRAGKKTHLCGVCGKALSDYRSLSRHKMTHSGERPHGCQVCGRRFKLPGTLRQHEKIHADRERSHLCDVCCKMFLTGKQLQIHLRTHSEEKPFHCGECGRGFATKGPLTIHMRVHTGETPYRCPDCGWAFKRKINLDNHVTVHSGLKPFVCGICGKACARKSYLTVHMRTHNGERPYKCSLCDKAFTQSHCLKTHMRSHQGAEAAT